MQNRPVFVASILLTIALSITACGGGGSDQPTAAPAIPIVAVESGQNQLVFRWLITPGATYYQLLENADGHSGFAQSGADIPANVLSTTLSVSVHLHDFVNALYIVQACNQIGCTGSRAVSPVNAMLGTIGYFKASNAREFENFGSAVALSADGTVLAVAARFEGSDATGINGDQNDISTGGGAGAVYIFNFDGTTWLQKAYIKASNTRPSDGIGLQGDVFGSAIALSADGNTLAVGAHREESNATGIGGDQFDNSLQQAGAVYLFRFDGVAWSQQAYIKASNTDQFDEFGGSVALNADGNTLAVGATGESSNATGINGDESDDSVNAGAVYLFRFSGVDWTQQAYVKASHTRSRDLFGEDVALSADGNTLAVGAALENSGATGINGNASDNSASDSGAAFLFRFDGSEWNQQAYIKASNTERGDRFGHAVSLSTDGNTLAVAANSEDGVNPGSGNVQNGPSTFRTGAAYLFRFDGLNWFEQAYITASNPDDHDVFGSDLALSSDGNTLAVGAEWEDSLAAGIGGDQNDDSLFHAGAVYVFQFDDSGWSQRAYVKASNTGENDRFGMAVSLSRDGNTLAVGATGESSTATGVNGQQYDDSAQWSGAVYLY